ncbi:hypothetical protein [Polaromonas sp.]|uniref:hypothetical protein n=1 Tax=Polaromonas sp. TaxID=1869339 RepID=UPI0037532DB7
MTKVIPLARARVAPTVHALALNPDPAAHQAAIENALSMALYFMRQPGNTKADLWAATARTNRALTLMKQASTEVRG